jgi:protein-S-isoprenylcysteine O-methyltransferase Ste14
MGTPANLTMDSASALARGPDPRRQPLALEGKRFIVRDHITAVVQLALALGAARALDWYNAWLYVSVLLAIKLSSALILTRVNPAVLNARGTKQTMSARERIFFSVFIPSSLAIPIVAGLDAGGAGWSHRSMTELVIGLGLVIAGSGLIIWALAVNAFFEPTVRLQSDRGHSTCSSGPYRFVRHPGYTGVILFGSGVPLALGSLWCFVPVAVMTVSFIVRTVYEDRMLHAELAGYEAYARETRYRLLPFVW